MKKLAIAALATLLTTNAFAAQGDILARFRVTNVNPQTSVDSKLAELDVNVKDDTIPEVDFTYMVTNNVGVELILGTSKHSVNAGSTELATVKVLPPTLTAQYHFNPQGEFRPYVGAGLNYTRFYGLKNKTSTILDVKKNSFGPALQVGIDTPLTKDIFLNFDVKKIWIKTKVSTGGTQLGTLDINPLVTSVGIGTKF